MIVKKVTQIGNKVIRTKAVPVASVTSKSTRKIVTDLIDSMRHHELVGMAAPQIGKGVRVFVTEVRQTKTRKRAEIELDPLRVFIDPKIISSSKKEVKGWEGCGSFATAGVFGLVRRPVSVEIQALDENGTMFEFKAKGLLARILQHEMDHLNGVVFVDRADPRTFMAKDEYLKMRAAERKQ